MDTTPLSRMPLSLAVSGRIRAAILDGSLPVGEALPTEQELAQTFSVGRSTVREALRVLQAQGLLTGADTTSTARPRVTHEHTADSSATALSTALQPLPTTRSHSTTPMSTFTLRWPEPAGTRRSGWS